MQLWVFFISWKQICPRLDILPKFSHNDSVFYLYMTENMLIKKLSQNIANMSVLSCLPFASTDDCRIMEIMKHNIKCICFFFFKSIHRIVLSSGGKKKKSDINSTGKNCTRDETVAVLILKKIWSSCCIM